MTRKTAQKRRRVAIDARHLHSGIGTYVCHLLREICEHQPPFEIVAVTRERFKDQLAGIPNVTLRLLEAPLYSLRAQWALPRITADCDLFHATHYDLPLFHRRKLVVTIHDLTHRSREFVPSALAWMYARSMLRLTTRRADLIITVSQFCRTQIIEQLGVPESKVRVIYHGVPDGPLRPDDRAILERRQPPGRAPALPNPYLLYVGNLKPHKNLGVVLHAMAAPNGRAAQIGLVIAGEGNQRESLEKETALLGLGQRVVFLGHVPAEQMASLYRGAELFVLPSLSEGFGLPILEAMAERVPVLAARASCLPEIVGEAGLLFDPLDPADLAEKIRLVVQNSQLRGDLVGKGSKRVQAFSWEKCVEEHIAAYEHVLLGQN